MKNILKGNKGITLIALIITIIILLILAGISIQALTSTGLFSNAKDAAEQSRMAQYKEEIWLDVQTWMTDYYSTNGVEALEEYLSKKENYSEVEKLEDGTIQGVYKQYLFEIDTKNNITILGKAGFTLTYNLSTSEYTKGPVGINLRYTLLEGTTLQSIELVEADPTDGITADENDITKYSVTKNGTYKFVAKDSSENTKRLSVVIDKIDTEKPNEFEPIVEAGSNSIKITVEATDKEQTNESACSGIAGYRFSKDNGVTYTKWQEEKVYTFTELEKGTTYNIKIQVKDYAENITEKEISVKTPRIVNAGDIKNNAEEYYGKIVTGYSCSNSAAVSNWQIFHSDGNNIYIISKNYIKSTYAPNSANNSIYAFTDYRLSFKNVCQDYTGSQNITNENPARKWLKWLSNHPSETSVNIKAIAYLLDTGIWSGFKGDSAEYAIGTPTLDLFAESYNQIYTSKTIQFNSSSYGVKYSTYENYQNNLGSLQSGINNLYITDVAETGMDGMWLASPTAYSDNTYLMSQSKATIDFGGVNGAKTNKGGRLGLRPVVCLNSNTQLEKQADGTYRII